jgi:hypothetical protein
MEARIMKENLNKAISWLYRSGRPLDVARYEFLFLNKSRDTLLAALKSYQNDDGGFGYGLEPDSQNPFSSPIQTWIALGIIEELGLDNKHEIVKNTLDYLQNKAPKNNNLFYATVPTNNSYPHAPWWHYSDESAIWGYNPTASIAGFMYKHALDKDSKYSAEKTISKAIGDFIKNPSNNMHELRSFLDMANYIEDFNKFDKSDEFIKLLLKQIDYNLEKNSDLWFKTYCVRPLQFFDIPGGYGFDDFKDLAKKEAEMILKQRNPEGIWDITWTWDQYPEAFAIAKRDWQSNLIIEYLKILKAYNILD